MYTGYSGTVFCNIYVGGRKSAVIRVGRINETKQNFSKLSEWMSWFYQN